MHTLSNTNTCILSLTHTSSLQRKRTQEEEEDPREDSLEAMAYCEEDDSEVDYEYSQSFDPFYFIKHLPPLDLCVPAYR